MPAPVQLPEWNTGGSNRTDPPSGTKISGLTVNGTIVSSYFNWWMWTVFQWVSYLSTITAEALTWTALQTWTGGGLFARNMNAPALTVTNTSTGISGTGVRAEGGTFGVDARGFIAVAGITTTAGGAGVSGESGFSNAAGVAAYNTAGGSAIVATSSGVGSKLLSGTAAGAGSFGVDVVGTLVGVRGDATDATGDGVIGFGGANGVRGSPASGTNGVGIRGTGDGSGQGGHFTGGATGSGVIAYGQGNGHGGEFVGAGAAPGVFGLGGATAPGGRFQRGDGITNTPALDVVGSIDFASASDPAGSVAIANQLQRKNLIKAWALVQLNNTATPTILDRMGVASVAQSVAGIGTVTVTMAQPMASAVYGVFAFANPSISNCRTTRALAGNTTQCTVEIYDPSAPLTVLNAANTNGVTLLVLIVGAQ